MKKILFLQIKGNSYAGVGFVNKVLADSFVNNNYDVEIMSVRDSFSGLDLEYDSRVKVSIVNKRDKWEIVHLSDVIRDLKKFRIISFIKKSFIMISDRIKLNKDYNYIREYIKDNNFDYIISSHYQLLDVIPEDYLKKTLHVHHTSFNTGYANKANRKYFEKFKDKVTFVWLTKATCDVAKEHGYLNSYYIYNPVKIRCEKRADVVNNKKLITVARISEEKRIDLMIKMVDEIFRDKKLSRWSLEIYGEGICKDEIMKMKYDKKRIKFMGVTTDVEEKLLSSSINLNTSLFEGFAMGILEGNECGVPTVSFNFGESIGEEIIQNKTGIYVPQNDVESYKKELKSLMLDEERLDKMSLECKKMSKNFYVDNIIKEWIHLFDIIDRKD